MTFEERKQKCIANGIVEGVTVQCAWMPKDFGRVSHPSEWQYKPSSNGGIDIWCERSQCFLYDADTDRYATVINLAEPSEVDRLRARVMELEEDNTRMRDALVSITEYWNKDRNDAAMHDACWHNVNTATEALTALAEQGVKPTLKP